MDVTGGLGSLGESVVEYALGGPLLPLLTFGMRAAGDQTAEMSKEGVGSVRAFFTALVAGIAEGGIEATGTGKFLSDFLIRAYPRHHVQSLQHKLFKSPEFCAACHKQFIDEEINQVGWVQLQNQYDNWRKSRWNEPGDPQKTIECRECHMPLEDSRDAASGDALDYNRTPGDGDEFGLRRGRPRRRRRTRTRSLHLVGHPRRPAHPHHQQPRFRHHP